MTTQLELSVVRIRITNGIAIGAGFLAGARQVLTCAHVVAAVLGLPDDMPEIQQARGYLDFPLVAPERILTARVTHWHVPRPGDGGEYPLPERFLAGQGTLLAVAKSGRSF